MMQDSRNPDKRRIGGGQLLEKLVWEGDTRGGKVQNSKVSRNERS